MRQSYHNQSAARQPVSLAGTRPGLRQLTATLLLALGLATGPAQAQQPRTGGFFQADAAARTAAAASPLATTLARSQALTLDEPGLHAALATAPLESRVGAAPLVLALPQPDGTSARFALREAPVMEPALAARYPMIKTYAGVGLDDATATVRLDLTPAGFHAQVLSSAAPGFDIDPASPTDPRHCRSYYRKDVRAAASQMAPCGVVTTPAEEQASAARVAAWRAAGGAAAARSTGAQLRVYRLALTCTPEYSLTRGNTTASVLAALVVTLNRTVGIFERELTMRLVLGANNDKLIFLSGTGPQPMPTMTDRDKFSLLDESEPNINRIIGEASYDLGHLINSSGGGGVANPGVLCKPGKGRGVSGDDVGTIAHEMGHQLGALHTFNSLSSGNNTFDTAWEPGAGVTIMSYGGGSGPNDVQPYREMLYHTGSYEAIQAVISAGNCGTSVATGNSAPVVSVPASGKTLPANTPFQLTATATDAENDPLTYSWEQLDLGPTGDLNMPQVTGETPPLFRFWLPTTSPTRYFPRLAELVKNTAPLGERLPTVTRGLKFRCTARDLRNGPAGLIGGVGLSALVSLNVSAAAGPFVVTAPNAAGLSWAGGSTQTVTWNVANTNTAPVSCAKVNLRLSLDGGLSYPTVLASNVNNSGTASITVPNVATTTARVMVEAADNYFFDISNANFAITPGPGPVISSFTPASGPVGTVVTLTGSNLTGATAVAFNGTAAASFRVVSATSITATVGAGSTSGLITVTTPAGTASSATPFLVGLPPTITSFTPTSGAGGTSVSITGTNFGGTTQVTLNGTNVESFFVNSATQLTVVLNNDATTGLLAVTTPLGRATSATPFTVPLVPVITEFTPQQGLAGTVVVVTGRHFSGATQVRFGGVAAPTFTVNSATQLTATVPAGAITGPISVTTPLGLGVSGGFFTVLLPPVFTAMSPTSGPAGVTVTLTGTSLDRVTALTLNGAAVPGYAVVNATTITFKVPAGASTGPVVAATAVTGTTANAGTFTVLPPAAGVLITGIVPASAITGGRIRLTGTGLSGATRVSFTGSGNNTASSGFTVNAAGTELSGLVVPTGAVTGVLTVTTPAGTSAASSQVFTLCAKPAVLAQNTRLVLTAAGTATLDPTTVNSGSSANCGVAAASTLSVVPNTFTTADVGPVVVARALSLNGNNQYVAIGGSATMPSGNSPYTIEAWIKPNSMGANSIFGWGNFGSAKACNVLRLSDTGLINYWWYNDLEVPTPSLVGAWHHVAATYDGTTRTLYLDGKAIGADQPGTHGVPGANNLRIGSANSGEYFNGLIDEVRVWNVARTAAQLNTAKGAHLLRNPAGLVAYYRFSEGSGTATADANGVAANAGTLTGGAGWSTDAPAVVNGVPVVLTVTDESGQTGTALAVVNVVAGTLATTTATATVFSVWPNPVGAKSTLHVRLAGPASGAHVSLRNGLGQVVSTRGFSGSTTELPTAGLASGLYLLSVQADGRAPAVRRVVVE